MKKRIVVGISGASGMPLAQEVLLALRRTDAFEIHLVVSDAALQGLPYESDLRPEAFYALADQVHPAHEMAASISSGSFPCEGMIVVPCSMKTVAGIACGYSDNLLLRAADVTIKEHRPLVLVVRECPLSAIHLENLTKLARLGVWIVPMMMTYYHRPTTIADMNRQLTGKILAPFGVQPDGCFCWGETT